MTRSQQDPPDDWHQPLRRVRAGELSEETAQTSGMARREAISAVTVGAQRLWMGETHVPPHTGSGDHHHGDSETAIHVLRGHPVFVFAAHGEEVRLQTGPGDYVFVPPYTPHREENLSDEEAVVLIARSSQGAIVVNLPSLLPQSSGADD
ncbi:cupin domain-containing protein [Modestobacter sp. VKM Ac-2983]|uniref:cupin domain-containing protein n=1 Tax=Modestobacter sp. VKM Ac-2983 TaxID=3004137 RepID=UPI0022AB7705|nr:cupin domain-containing protein [Modestobacter sp. VKM Ac-2983]MCZ2804601.1 cupin domain-containing protein [Modestobacter sp. VKM Ac-2983]